MDGASLRWLVGIGALVGLGAGMLAFRWKRRSSAAWMILGVVTLGAAILILACLPTLERRTLLPDRQRNWHQ